MSIFSNKKVVTLALQGGGSHGAFTWGVLDRILEDGRMEIEGVSGASAGAMNASVMAYGYVVGGRDGARESLRRFWESVASKRPFASVGANSVEALDAERLARYATPTPGMMAMMSLTRFFSPYQLNPFDVNPLRDILAAQIDFERLRTSRIKLFIAATRVSTGTLKLFRRREVSLEVLLASACLPSIHHAVEIDGEPYWDGGFTANPHLFPLVEQCDANDLMIVFLPTAQRREAPTTASSIYGRLVEIGFNAAISTELQALALATREARQGLFAVGRLERRMRHLHLHSIESEEFLTSLSTASRINTDPAFLHSLFVKGREHAEQWLDLHFKKLGRQSTLPLERFLP